MVCNPLGDLLVGRSWRDPSGKGVDCNPTKPSSILGRASRVYLATVEGRQLLVELWGCDATKLDKTDEIAAIMRRAVAAMKSQPLHSSYRGYWPGVGAVNVMEEGHMAFRSDPGAGYASLDVFTVGPKCKPEEAVEVFRKALKATTVLITYITRGGTDGIQVHAPEVPLEGRQSSNLEAVGSSPAGSADREAQMDERLTTNQEGVGSSPTVVAPVLEAQQEEHPSPKREVAGSTPAEDADGARLLGDTEPGET